MANLKIILDTRRARKDGTYPVKLQISHKGRVGQISTDIYALPEQFESGLLNRNAQNWKTKNMVLQGMMSDAELKVLELTRRDALVNLNINQLKDILSQKDEGMPESKRFIDYLDEFTSLKNNAGTISIYQTTRSKIMEYDPNCTFESMDKRWLSGFENWMIASGMKINAYAIHLRNIRAIFNYALDEEYTSLYPFRKFKIKKEETRKRSLTVEQLVMLRDYPCEEYQKKYRDMFMLMFYLVGINAVDLFSAKPKSIVTGRLEYKRAKTGKLYSPKIEPEALEIIEKYKGDEWLLNVRDKYVDYKDYVRRMDNYLKKIGECKRVGLGGKKIITPLFPNISSYWARHTWATIAASLDIPKETISAALGHEIGSKVTSIYIDFDKKKIDKANRMVLDYISKIKKDS